MYQIIYIDIDEEITSVIDKLRKVKTAEVFLAIPKRALILQSILSLKLLCREAEKSRKEMIVVTQDPQERRAVEKAGIETRNSLEGLDTDGEMRESVVPKIQEENVSTVEMISPKDIQHKSVEEIGSSDFYAVSAKNEIRGRREMPRENLLSPKNPRRMMTEISREKKVERPVAPLNKEELFESPIFSATEEKKELLGSLFGSQRVKDETFKTKKAVQPKVSVSGRLKKIFLTFFLAGLLVVVGVVGYLFLPQAQVRVAVKSQTMEKDLDMRGDVNVAEADLQKMVIPVQLVEKEATYEFVYPVTGRSATVGKKARGTVVIYNEFSSATQSLVATTRLESKDKKIFRLTKGVIVPGTSEVGGKVVPGAIEAEVVAEAIGEEYNIDPTTFTIPGFSGSPKFEKFSAKSTEKMLGGNSQNQSAGATSLTQTDIAMAKGKAEATAKGSVLDELRNEIGADGVFFESATEVAILESGALAKSGDAVSEFGYKVRIQAKALVFVQADVKKMFLGTFKIPDNDQNQARITLDYGAVSGDLASKTMTIKVHGKLSSSSELDVEQLKADLAGKNGAEVEESIKGYSQISEIEIIISPAFLFDKVPQITSRIDVIVD